MEKPNGTDTELLREIVKTKQLISHAKRSLHKLEAELQMRMREKGATKLATHGYTAQITTKTEYDVNKVTPIFELLPPEETDGLVYTPTPPARRVSGTVARKLMRYGGEVAATLEKARIPTVPTVEVKRRGEK